MNRRTMLAAVPSVMAFPVAAQQVKTPVRVLFDEWQIRCQQEEDTYNAHPDEPGCEANLAAADRAVEIENRILAEPATGLSDMMLKFCVMSCFGGWDARHEAELWDEARTLVEGAA